VSCSHTVSAQVGKPCLSLYLNREPTGALHLWWHDGTCDEPSSSSCFEWGPFDGAQDVESFIGTVLSKWLRQALSWSA
jgi:hypothetical protein